MSVHLCAGLTGQCPVREPALFDVAWVTAGRDRERAQLGTQCTQALRHRGLVTEIEIKPGPNACEGSVDELCPDDNAAAFRVSWQRANQRRRTRRRLCGPCVSKLRTAPACSDIDSQVFIPKGAHRGRD